MAYDDIDPQDIDPDTGRPYANYSSPALDTSFHDAEMDPNEDPEDEVECPECGALNPEGDGCWQCDEAEA